MLELAAVHAGYGRAIKALDAVDLAVPDGGTVALLGPNGAGKTTTLRTAAGLLRGVGGRLLSGVVRLDGEDVTRLSPRARVGRGIAVVPEGRRIFGQLTVDENLRVGATTRRGAKAVSDDVDRMYTRFPALADKRGRQAGWMSGGEQQMVAIARALMSRPRLLLADELTLGLAPQVIESIFETLKTINREEHLAILLVEQNANLALDLCEYGYLLESGRIVLHGRADDLRRDDDLRDVYLGSGGPVERPREHARAGHEVGGDDDE